MIPRLKPALSSSELLAALSITDGNAVESFEQEFARLAEQKHAIAFPYGRTAMIAILKALELEHAQIICPSYTCVVVPHAIVFSGNSPLFVDTEPGHFNMDLKLVAESVTPSTKAIVSTSIFGHPVNLDQLDRIRARFPELVVIQDCAHSFFCEWNGRPVHREGLCAFYGLNISKIMTSVFGGIVTTDSDDFADKLRQVRATMLSPAGLSKSIFRFFYLVAVYVAFTRPVYGLINRLERKGWLDRFVKYYDPQKIDMPVDYLSAMAELEARVGKVQCRNYNTIVSHRRRLAAIYRNGLANLKGLQLPPDDAGSTYSHFVLRCEKAVEIKNKILQRGIQLGDLIDYYIPSMETYANCKVIGSGKSASLPAEVVNLPVHMGMSEADAVRLIDLMRQEFDN